ncbi:hypothetical protein LXL04_037549 [Taraxacum kok-saghyz]
MAASNQNQSQFQDFLPVMAQKLGGDGLIEELYFSDADLMSMVREGDFDGDGGLSQMEFCVLMFRLSPDLMEQSEFLLEEALEQEFNNFRS